MTKISQSTVHVIFMAGTKFMILAQRKINIIIIPTLVGGVSLSKSGIVPTGRSFPVHKPGANTDYINPGDVNLHLLPSNPQANDQYMVHTTFRPDKAGGSASASVQFMVNDVPCGIVLLLQSTRLNFSLLVSYMYQI